MISVPTWTAVVAAYALIVSIVWAVGNPGAITLTMIVGCLIVVGLTVDIIIVVKESL